MDSTYNRVSTYNRDKRVHWGNVKPLILTRFAELKALNKVFKVGKLMYPHFYKLECLAACV